MIKHLALAAGLVFAAIGGVSAATVSPLGGTTAAFRVDVEPPAGVTGSFEVADGTATQIVVDLDIRHRGASWGRETRLRIEAPNGNVYRFLGGRDFGWGSTGGNFSTVYTRDIAPIAAGGTWNFRFSDSFDDLADPDYVIRRGSSISVNGMPAPVPLPASAALLLLGVGGLAVMRRKSKA
ncbi:MAG: VPLPA-CTERM sorting domain-containing protein [Pseudomonadota bacterium]